MHMSLNFDCNDIAESFPNIAAYCNYFLKYKTSLGNTFIKEMSLKSDEQAQNATY